MASRTDLFSIPYGVITPILVLVSPCARLCCFSALSCPAMSYSTTQWTHVISSWITSESLRCPVAVKSESPANGVAYRDAYVANRWMTVQTRTALVKWQFIPVHSVYEQKRPYMHRLPMLHAYTELKTLVVITNRTQNNVTCDDASTLSRSVCIASKAHPMLAQTPMHTAISY